MTHIGRYDIRKGDRIRVTKEYTVATDPQPGMFNGKPVVSFTQEGLPGTRTNLFDGNDIVLLDRPISLPTKVGAVIEIDFGSAGKSRWFLQEAFWVNGYGSTRSRKEFEDWFRTNNYTFEVIA